MNIKYIFSFRIRGPWPVLCCLLSLCSGAAAESLTEGLSLHGFGTLGVLYNDDGDIRYIRNIAQSGTGIDEFSYKQDTRLGVQLNYQPAETWSGALQVLSRYRYDHSFTPEINLAFLKYLPTPEVELRGGRLGLNLFFRSDSRDIGYSYLWSRPPVDYYGQLNTSRVDGIDMTRWFMGEQGLFHLKGFLGYVNQKFPGFNHQTMDFSGSPIYGVLGEFQRDDVSVKIGVSEMQLRGQDGSVDLLVDSLRSAGQAANVAQAVRLADALAMIDKRFRYYSLGLALDRGPWKWQFALSSIQPETLLVPDNRAAYLSLGYKQQQWTPYVLLSGIASEEHKVSSGIPAAEGGDSLDAAANAAIRAGSATQYTLGFGARYDLLDTLALKFQVDFFRSLNTEHNLLHSYVMPEWDGQNTIYSLTIDFIF